MPDRAHLSSVGPESYDSALFQQNGWAAGGVRAMNGNQLSSVLSGSGGMQRDYAVFRKILAASFTYQLIFVASLGAVGAQSCIPVNTSQALLQAVKAAQAQSDLCLELTSQGYAPSRASGPHSSCLWRDSLAFSQPFPARQPCYRRPRLLMHLGTPPCAAATVTVTSQIYLR
jgi:hypothetical protein